MLCTGRSDCKGGKDRWCSRNSKLEVRKKKDEEIEVAVNKLEEEDEEVESDIHLKYSAPNGRLKNLIGIGKNSVPNCTICGKDFIERASLTMLAKTHTEGNEYHCELCGKGYQMYSALKYHVETHIGEKLYQCEICRKDFFKSCGLEDHMKTHTGEKPFHCEICGLDYPCIFTLKMHIKDHHNEEKPFQCELCGKDFAMRANLRMHIQMHNGEKLCNCKVCKKNFLLNSILENHLRTYSAEKPFYYEVCGKDFAIRMHFVVRMSSRIVDADNWQFHCDKCRPDFPCKISLQIQIKTHNGEKAFHNSVCGKDFTADCQLKELTPKRSQHFVKCIRKALLRSPFKHSMDGTRVKVE